MILKTLHELLKAQPFQPFRLIMSSGKTYEVRDPAFARLSRAAIYLGVDIAEDGIPAEFVVCSLLHVNSVEPLSE